MTVKVLCLHGYGQNKLYLREQLKELESKLSNTVEFIVIDAPNLIPKFKMELSYPKYSKKYQKLLDIGGMKSWWNLTNEGYIGLYCNTLPYINYIIDKYGPFNGILGFSQGACLAYILNSLISQNSPLINKIQYPLDFIVLSSGFFPRDPNISQFSDLPLKTPCLNIIDKDDKVVKADYSIFLSSLGLKNSFVFHSNGHNMPNDEDSVEDIKNFILKSVSRVWVRL